MGDMRIAPIFVSTTFRHRVIATAFVLAGFAASPTPSVHAALGDCGQPVSSGNNPTASDCLFILRSAVGAATCAPACICDTNGVGGTTATDALVCLAKAVGQPVNLNCPCVTEQAKITMTVNPDPARPGEALDVQLLATNTGPVPLLDVVVELRLPAQLADFPLLAARGATAACIGPFVAATCSPGETVRWTVGTLAPGDAAHLSIPPLVKSSAPAPADGTEISFAATMFAAAVQIATEESVVLVDSQRALELAIDEDRDPVSLGGRVVYRVSYGNRGATLSQSSVVRVTLPEGVSFVEASDGGTLGAGDVVEWSLGTLSPGDTGVRELIVDAEGFGPGGGAIVATARMVNQAGATVEASAVTTVRAEAPLVVSLALVPDPAEPGEGVTGTVTVSNRGDVALTGVTVELALPQDLADFALVAASGATAQCVGTFVAGTCSTGEILVWTVGTLGAGAGVTLTTPIPISLGAAAGTVVSFEARARNDGGRRAGARESVRVTSARLLDLAVEEEIDPVSAGAQLRYVLSFGNSGATLAQDTVLTARLPEGAGFLDASDGGVPSAGGIVEWQIGTLSPGDTSTRELWVELDSEALDDGDVFGIAAHIDAASGPRSRAAADTRVQGAVPLLLAMELNPDPARPGETLSGVLTVTNTGLVPLVGLEVEVVLPQETGDFFLVGTSGATAACAGTFVSSTCSAYERVVWTIGTLAPNAGVTLTMPPHVGSDVPAGTVFTFAARARATGGVNVAVNETVRVESTRVIDVSLDDGDGDPSLAGGVLAYRVAYGNASAALAQNVTLQLVLPGWASLLSASDGGALDTLVDGEVVSWSLGTLMPGETGTRDCLVEIAPGVDPGAILRARAQVDDESGARTRVRADTRIQDDVPLLLAMELGPDPIEPGANGLGVLTLTNTGLVSLQEIQVEVLLPPETLDFALVGVSGATAACAGTFVVATCSAEERLVWTVGTLAAGSGITLTMPPGIKPATAPGTVATFEARARATGGVNTAVRSTLRVETPRVLDVSLDDGSGDPAVAGEDLVYAVHFGNPTGGLALDTTLALAVPAGTSFVAASDDGEIGDDDVVRWAAGTLAPGDVGTREMTVSLDGGLADGSIVRAAVQMDSSSGARTHAAADTRVHDGSPLTLTFDLDPQLAIAGQTVNATLVVGNAGLVPLLNVQVEVILPVEMANFSVTGATGASAACLGTFVVATCSALERLVFTVGTLAAGADATLRFPPGPLAGTPLGTQIAFEARAYATGVANVALRRTLQVSPP
jgi:uncharacterized repeat protein (TIGR01451 family)